MIILLIIAIVIGAIIGYVYAELRFERDIRRVDQGLEPRRHSLQKLVATRSNPLDRK
jgi:uncharacterized membrane-anchored protein YhcB (DUF1043 family)